MWFMVEVVELSAANDVRGNINAMILENSAATVSAMRSAGLNEITGVSLISCARSHGHGGACDAPSSTSPAAAPIASANIRRG